MDKDQVTDVRDATSPVESFPAEANFVQLLDPEERFENGDIIGRIEDDSGRSVNLEANCDGVFMGWQDNVDLERLTISVRFIGDPAAGVQEAFRTHLFKDLLFVPHGRTSQAPESAYAPDDEFMPEGSDDGQNGGNPGGGDTGIDPKVKAGIAGGAVLVVCAIGLMMWPRGSDPVPTPPPGDETIIVEPEREAVRAIDIETTYRRMLENLIASRRMREVQLANQRQANNPDLQGLSDFIADKLEDIDNAEKVLARNREEFLLSVSTLNQMSQSSPNAFDEATKTMIRMMGSPNPPEHRDAVIEIRDIVSSNTRNAREIEDKTLIIWQDWVI